MKIKFIFPIILAIFIGFLSSKLVYAIYNTNEKEKYNAFFLEVVDKDSANNSTKNSNYFITINKKDNKGIYCAISSKINNINKMKKVYDSKKTNTRIKKVYIDNKEFVNNLEQFDVLLSNVYKESDLISITKVILSSYEDIVLNT